MCVCVYECVYTHEHSYQYVMHFIINNFFYHI